jgi:hypothetical protein
MTEKRIRKPVNNDDLIDAAADMLEALLLHVDYQAMANDRNGDDAKALAFGRFLTARDAAIAKAEGWQ